MIQFLGSCYLVNFIPLKKQSAEEDWEIQPKYTEKTRMFFEHNNLLNNYLPATYYVTMDMVLFICYMICQDGHVHLLQVMSAWMCSSVKVMSAWMCSSVKVMSAWMC